MTSIDRQLASFERDGYIVVADTLSDDELATINEVIDRDLVENTSLWRGDPKGRYQNVHMLLAHPEMDLTMRPLPCCR